jgi:hypothetical protein
MDLFYIIIVFLIGGNSSGENHFSTSTYGSILRDAVIEPMWKGLKLNDPYSIFTCLLRVKLILYLNN